MSLVSICQHGKQSPNHQNNFVGIPLGNYSKISCIMVMPMVIPCYQMVTILLQFIQTIFIQIWNQLAQWFCGSQWINWIRNLKMNSKIKLIKVERILVQVVPRFYDMMPGEPPNHRTVQRDDRRLPQLRGDWSPRRSSTIIPSSVHIKLIKHPISMVPMWKFPISTMVSFRVCFFERGKGFKNKKTRPFPFRMRHAVPGGSRRKESTNISQIFGTMFGVLILGGCH